VLVSQQKAAIRIITSSRYNSHTEPLFKSQRILPFNDLVLFFKLQFMQQFKQGFLPHSFNGEWVSNAARFDDQDQDPMELRNINLDNFIVPFARLTATERFPLTSFPRAWNSFENFEIKTIYSKLDFNHKLKQFFLDKLNANYTCNRLLCPNCHL
jgi:hypothetical protein